MPTWNTAADWDGATAESGVVHESVSNTDHNDSAIVKRGYRIASPYLSSNLIGYWPLHEDSGSTAYDFSSSNNNGDISGATVGASGLLGTTCYDFDGSDDVVSVPGFSPDPPYSFSVWANVDRLGSNEDLFGIRGSVSQIQIYKEDDSDEWYYYDGNQHDLPNSPTVNDNEWYHIVVTLASNNDGTWYLDGSKKGDFSPSFNSSTADFTFGASRLSSGAWDGRVWQVSVYDKELSLSEVQTLYNVVNTNGTLTTDYRSG